MPKVNCLICDKIFYAAPKSIINGGGKYCSRICFGISHRRRIVRSCKKCNKEFEVAKLDNRYWYCSKECSRHKNKKIDSQCPTCGKTISIYEHQIKNGKPPFCSRSCIKWEQRENKTIVKRFLKKILVLPGPNSCWVWMGLAKNNQYPPLSTRGKGQKNRVAAHRFSYEYFRRPFPKEMLVCHNCHKGNDIPFCVNPNHLFLGTHQDNVIDAVIKGHKSKLTVQQVKEILIRKDKNQKELAREYKIHKNTISSIKNRKTWKYIEF